MNSISPSSSLHSERSLSTSPSSSSSQPSARFLYNQAAQTFLTRQHASTLDLLETLFRQLPLPKQDWTSASLSPGGREKDREEVRRKAVVLWITCLACIFTDQRRAAEAAAGAGGGGGGKDALFGGRAEDLYEHLVHRSFELFAVTSSSSSSRTSTTLLLPPPLPPTIAHTLILTSIKLGLPSFLPRDLVVLPFLTSLPPTLTDLLAAQSRKRETREGTYDRTRGTEGWIGDMLDGYEKVLEGWCVTVLAQSEGKVREATERIGEDGVLGKAKKEELLQTLNHLPPLTPSPPANISLLPLHSPSSSLSSSGILSPPPPRPVSPALSDASETTATPNNFRVVGGGKAKGRESTSSRRAATDPSEEITREVSNWSYSAFTDRLRRFVAPRPAPPTSSSSDASNLPAVNAAPSRLTHPLLVALRSHLSNLKLPASVLLVLVLAVIGMRRWWVRRGRVNVGVAAAAAPRDVRSRLGKSILARILS